VLVLGAGAAGMICAIEAGRRGRSVAAIDHARAPGEKIRISGGGRCNFTNLHSGPRNFLSANPRFAISALTAFTPQDFVARVERRGIAYHEKTLGQLFCDGSSKQIVALLTDGMAEAGARLHVAAAVETVERHGELFRVATSAGTLEAPRLVVATGGKSVPKMGASAFGYRLAERFGHALVETRPALVPFTWPTAEGANGRDTWADLSGVALPVRTRCNGGSFDEAMLVTHRGLSGPAMLQISSYWREGEAVEIDLLPGTDAGALLREARATRGKAATAGLLAEALPKRLAQRLADDLGLAGKRVADLDKRTLARLAETLNRHRFVPGGTEGYRTAEVTLGGVDTRGLDQKTMESRHTPGLYFVGEVVDVTGHLGGHNFQWAWASGVAAGRAV
jgi:hypothetical protein